MILEGKISISDIFAKRRYYVVPKYQRSYAWKEKQQRDFFEDFKNNYKSTNYYYGTLLLQEDKENENRYEIVDGQQRITTLVIFMYCVISKLKEIENIEEYGMTKDDIKDLEEYFIKKGDYKLTLQNNKDTEFFHSCILGEEGKFTIQNPAQRKLSTAKENFKKWLKQEMSSPEDLIGLVDKVSRANALVYTIGDRKEATLIFETTNDRGKSLTNLEKQKSYLMYKVTATLEDPTQLLNKIEGAFTSIYEEFEKIENEFDEEQILQYNFIAKEKWKNENGKKTYQHYMENLKNKIEELIEKGNKEIEIKKQEENKDFVAYTELREYIEKYIVNLQNTYNHMALFSKNEKLLELKDMKSIGRMANFYPLLIKCYEYDTEEKFRKVCRLCEIFIFRVYVIAKFASSKYQTKWYELAKSFEGDFEKLYIEIASLTRNLSKDESFIKDLKCEDFYIKYKTPERNYFFWKYENYLRKSGDGKYTLMPHTDLWERENKKIKLSIEHIVAQANSNEKQRIISDNEIIQIGDEKDFNNTYLHCIGNLTIDPQSANSSKGDDDVSEKMSKYFTKAPYMSQNELESFLVSDDNNNKLWTIDSILNRSKKILDFAKETWCTTLNEYEQIDGQIEEDDDETEE